MTEPWTMVRLFCVQSKVVGPKRVLPHLPLSIRTAQVSQWITAIPATNPCRETALKMGKNPNPCHSGGWAIPCETA